MNERPISTPTGLDRAEELLTKAKRDWFKESSEFLILADVALMLGSLIFCNLETMWLFALFQIVAVSYGIFVLYLASRAAKVIPPSIPLQRPMGVVLYITAHSIQFGFSGELPLLLDAVVLFAAPISIFLLFTE